MNKFIATLAILVFYNNTCFSDSKNIRLALGVSVVISKGWGPAPLLYVQGNYYLNDNIGISLNFKTLIIGYYEIVLEPFLKINTSDFNSMNISGGMGYSLSVFHHSFIYGIGFSNEYIKEKAGLSLGSKFYLVDYGKSKVLGYLKHSSDLHLTYYPFIAVLL